MADDGVESEQGLDQLVAEIALEDFGRRLGEEVDELALLLEAQPVDAGAELEQRDQVGKAAAGIGRRAKQPLPDHTDHRVQRRRIGVVIRRVGRAVAGDLPLGEAAAAGEQIVGSERRQEIVDLAEHDLEAMLVEPHVADDLGVEQADRVARRRVAEAGMEFLGHRGAADDAARFEDRHLEAARGEIISADQAVMAGADDQHVRIHGRAIGSHRAEPPASPSPAS